MLRTSLPCIRIVWKDGVACVRVQTADDQEMIDGQFDPICKRDGFDSGVWVFGRLEIIFESSYINPKIEHLQV